ncbi:NAD(P)H dehydrogenase (quinone) [Dermatophilus congolensis]|uniref:NAD(P)H dehydrogenase (Quinone) n=1 Tax=Dermatophilus congolensis TaxID=1863 RepID=A0A239VBT4_9MICO|nr:NAD(P)H dehydrogenase (quinone) [Dermatophilus congolensis]
MAWNTCGVSNRSHRFVVVGGGPGGYEAALVAASGGAEVTLVNSQGVGGAAVLMDCVPSKALIASAGYLGRLVASAQHLGVHYRSVLDGAAEGDRFDLREVNDRVRSLAAAQSGDIEAGLVAKGIEVVRGRGRLDGARRVVVDVQGGGSRVLEADTVLLATGARPRRLGSAMPDGERILTWQDIWSLEGLPDHLVVIGSGVTGAELAQAYLHLGSRVTLVSSREHVLPNEDEDAARAIEEVFRGRGMEVLARSRAESVERVGDGVVVRLQDGREVVGSHALMAVGSLPNTEGIGLEEAGVEVNERGQIVVDRVSRTSVSGVYAAGDCTGVLPLASVAAMQGRIAVAHAIGDEVRPLTTTGISANIFTDPEIATVGMSAAEVADESEYRTVVMPLDTNPRAKMEHIENAFVKLFAQRRTGQLVGGVVVAPRASELIFPIALAVEHRLTADDVARTITVYPSLSGSLAEAARRLHAVDSLPSA